MPVITKSARLLAANLKRKWLWHTALAGLLLAGAATWAHAADAQTTAAKPDANKADSKPDPKAAKPQTPPAQDKPADAASDTTTVTVTGQKPANRIDRQVYDNTKDPDSQTGTAADALNKVPGVNVDPNGNVTLRGKSPQILINGKPSPMMSGDNRAAALQAMPSGTISSIEVMNNPGAQYGTDNASSVINIVTKTSLPPGGFGSANGQLMSTGGYMGILFGQYHVGKISFTGTLGTRRDVRTGNSGSVLRQLDSAGNTVRSTQSNGQSNNENDSLFTSGNLDYTLSDKDSVTGQFSYARNLNTNDSLSHAVIYSPAGAATDIYTRTGISKSIFESQMIGASWNHTGSLQGETLKVDARLSRTLNNSTSPSLSLYTLSTVPANLAGRQSLFRLGGKANNSTLSVDYNRPIGDDQLTAGIQITSDNNFSLNRSFGPDPAGTAILTYNPLFANEYVYSQKVSAAYFTYQKPFGDHWSVLGGLRSETFELNANAVTSNLTNHVKYTTYNPSFFATYVLSDRARIRFSYSHRLQRPTAQDYNPATILYNEQNVSVGQPNLKPQETDSYEMGYEYSYKGTSYQVRGYHTGETGMILSVSTFIADPLNLGNQVLRTSKLNAGTRDTTGVEVNFNGKLTPKLTLSVNGNLSTVDYRTPNFTGAQSVTGLGGRVSVNYTVTKNDTLVMSYNISPRILSGQGYRSGYGTANIQYSHKLTPKATLVFALNDAFRSSKTDNVTSTASVYSLSSRSNQAPTFSISLNRRFGGSYVPPKNAGNGPVIIGPGGGQGAPSGSGTTVIVRPGG